MLGKKNYQSIKHERKPCDFFFRVSIRLSSSNEKRERADKTWFSSRFPLSVLQRVGGNWTWDYSCIQAGAKYTTLFPGYLLSLGTRLRRNFDLPSLQNTPGNYDCNRERFWLALKYLGWPINPWIHFFLSWFQVQFVRSRNHESKQFPFFVS